MAIASSWSEQPGAPRVDNRSPLLIPVEYPTGKGLSNLRLKLSGCGGRLIGKGSLLIAAAAPRSLSAIR